MRWRLLAAGLTSSLLFTVFGSAALAQAGADSPARKRSSACPSPSALTPAAAFASKNAVDLAKAPAACQELIVDGGFEGGTPSAAWTETSTNFPTPLCDANCGGGGTAGPFAGSWWAWFGGTSNAENATAGQTVTIPAGSFATLRYQLWIGAIGDQTARLTIRVDGTAVQQIYPFSPESGYSLRSIDLDMYADGNAHTILFDYVAPAQTTVSNFSVDNVSLQACDSPPTAVTVASTSARRTSRGVFVRWATGSDSDLLGFRVHRQDGSKRVRVNSTLVRAKGAFAGSRYGLIDRRAPRGRALRYWIEAVHFDGSTTWHGPAVASS